MNDKKITDNFDFDLPGPAAIDDAESSKGGASFQKEDPRPKKKSKKILKKTPKSRLRRFIGLGLWLLSIGFLLGLAVLFAGYMYFSKDLPSTASLKIYEPKTVTHFYSDDGRIVAEYYHEQRFLTPLTEIPPHVINAFLSVEDAKFYSHHGVNFKAIIRAIIINYIEGNESQGASTITQQVVRSFLLSREKTYTRKIKEMILAMRIENNLSKDEILYIYLNHIYLGRGAYGVEAAARRYFDKNIQQLSIAEAAMLAGITHSPEGKNPITNPDEARSRQLHGIRRMLATGAITEEQAEAARNEVLIIQADKNNVNLTVAPYFAEHVRRILEEKLGEDSLYNDGWKVYTTVSIEAQKAADDAVARGLREYARRRGFKGPITHLENDEQINIFISESEKNIPSSGLQLEHLYQAVVINTDEKNSSLNVRIGPYYGQITKKELSWALSKGGFKKFKRGDVLWVRILPTNAEKISSANAEPDLAALISENNTEYIPMSLEQRTDLQAALFSMDAANGDVKAMVGGRDFTESQFNRAVQSQRQPGSSFKPIVYAAAMEHGFTPGSVMVDAPLVIDDRGSGKRWKPVNADLKFNGPMTLYSALVSSRNLISVKLLDRIGFDALDQTAQAMGITEKLPHSLTVALGAHGIRIPELVTAYSVFPNMGTKVLPRYIYKIEDRHGNVVYSSEPVREPAINPGAACAVNSMLEGVVAQGTGTSVKALNRPVAGKTGTTNDYSDAWFVGYTPELITAVWLGTDQQRPRAVGEVGGRAAGPIFLYYMQKALQGIPVHKFSVPQGVEITPGGANGICYIAGTVGKGLSETINENTEEDAFLREDFSDNFEGLEGETIGGGAD